jgi:hypothetical protein
MYLKNVSYLQVPSRLFPWKIFYSLTLRRKPPVLLGLKNRRKEKKNLFNAQALNRKIHAIMDYWIDGLMIPEP